MPFMLIATWNDYEEGTQIETGVSDCHGKDDKRNTDSAGEHAGGGDHSASEHPGNSTTFDLSDRR